MAQETSATPAPLARHLSYGLFILAGGLLAGCKDSPRSEASRQAVEVSRQVQASQQLPGELKAKADFADKILVPKEPEEFTALLARVKKRVGESGDGWKSIAEERSSKLEIEQAREKLTKALSGELELGVQGVLQLQLGLLEAQQSREFLVSIARQFAKASTLAAKTRSLAEDVATYDNQIKSLKARIQAPDNQSLNDATTEVDKTKKSLQDLTQQLAGLESSTQELQSKANGFLAQSDQQRVESQKLQGQASLACFKAAMDLRNQADEVNSQIASLQARAVDLSYQKTRAEMTLESAQASLKLAQERQETTRVFSQSLTQELQELEAAQQTLISPEQSAGLPATYQAFCQAVDLIDPLIQQANKASDKARKLLSQAGQTQKSIGNQGRAMVPDPAAATMQEFLSNPAPEALLKTYLATESLKSAVASVTGAMADSLATSLRGSLTKVLDSSKLGEPPAPARLEGYQKSIRSMLDQATETIGSATASLGGRAGPEIQGLVTGIASVTYYSNYLATTDTAARAELLLKVQNSVDQATKANPNAVVPDISGLK